MGLERREESESLVPAPQETCQAKGRNSTHTLTPHLECCRESEDRMSSQHSASYTVAAGRFATQT